MTTSEKKFLIFSAHQSLFALDLAQVAEVSDLPKLSPIPLAPSYYCGALNFHGDIVAVVNFGQFLTLSGNARSPGKIIVLYQRGVSLALFVDAVIQVVSESEVSLDETCRTDFGAGTIRVGAITAILLDLEALVRKAETGISCGHASEKCS